MPSQKRKINKTCVIKKCLSVKFSLSFYKNKYFSNYHFLKKTGRMKGIKHIPRFQMNVLIL